MNPIEYHSTYLFAVVRRNNFLYMYIAYKIETAVSILYAMRNLLINFSREGMVQLKLVILLALMTAVAIGSSAYDNTVG